MNPVEVRNLAQLYRNGLMYGPPEPHEVPDFNASRFMPEYVEALSNFQTLTARLMDPGAERADKLPYVEAKQKLEELRDALRADWTLRKAERLVARTIELRDLPAFAEANVRQLFPAEFR